MQGDIPESLNCQANKILYRRKRRKGRGDFEKYLQSSKSCLNNVAQPTNVAHASTGPRRKHHYGNSQSA
jgi:hypothetical protein